MDGNSPEQKRPLSRIPPRTRDANQTGWGKRFVGMAWYDGSDGFAYYKKNSHRPNEYWPGLPPGAKRYRWDEFEKLLRREGRISSLSRMAPEGNRLESMHRGRWSKAA